MIQHADLILYGISNCDSVKKARAWLDAAQQPYIFHDFRKMGITAEILQRWSKMSSWESLINRRGSTWRKLTPAQQILMVNETQAIAIMINHSSLIKRPVLETPTTLHIGFDPDIYKALVT